MKRRLALLSAATFLVIAAVPEAQTPARGGATIDTTQAAPRVQRLVETMAAADSIDGRREAIIARIRTLGLEPQLVGFDLPTGAQAGRRGTNVIARIPGGTGPTILLGAHYDRVARGRGVIDNAAGVAAVLELAEALVRQPLPNHTVEIAFWDLEESGLLGSRARVADSLRTPLPQLYLNFDIFGYGNAFMVGAVNRDAAFPRQLQQIASATGTPVTVDTLYPPSDHLSFRPTSTESYAISILSDEDVTKVLGMLRSGAPPAGEPPPIFRILHSDADSMDKLDAAAVARGVRVVEAAIRTLDSEPRAPGR